MNKVITVNLDGIAYQIEEDGYEALNAYLESAAARLENNPDREEILSDIERAIAEKFRALLSSNKTVVTTKEAAAVVAEMGPIEADPGEGAGPGRSGAGGPGGPGEEAAPGRGGQPRRLYRIYEGAMVSGVCNGLAAYMNVDPTFVRLAFVLLTLCWGTGLLVYLVMAIVVPVALSPEEKSAASGPPPTAQEFIRRAKEGYYGAMKGFPDRKARREWQRRFHREMRGWGRSFAREMRVGAEQCRCRWHGFWAERAPIYPGIHPGLAFALPLLSLLHGAASVLMICAFISLLATSTVFGVALPAKVPVWVAALLLCMVYGVLTSPLKAAPRACYWGCGRPGWAWPFVFLLDAVVWLAIVATLAWLAVRFFPEIREAVRGIPALTHQAAEDIRNWWNSK